MGQVFSGTSCGKARPLPDSLVDSNRFGESNPGLHILLKIFQKMNEQLGWSLRFMMLRASWLVCSRSAQGPEPTRYMTRSRCENRVNEERQASPGYSLELQPKKD